MQSAFCTVQLHVSLDRDYFIQLYSPLFQLYSPFYNFSCRARVIAGKFICWFHYIIIMFYIPDYALKLSLVKTNQIIFYNFFTNMLMV